MSTLIQSFDPANPLLLDGSGKGTIRTNGVNSGEQLVLYNSSLTAFILTFLDKTEDIMPPSWARSYKKLGRIGSISYTPLFTLTALSGSQPISLCYGVIYESSEFRSDIDQPISYVTNIGNPGGLSLSTNTLDNEGNAGSYKWLNVVPSDTAGLSSFQGLVDGTFLIQADRAGTLTQVLKVVPAASVGTTSLFLGETTRTAEFPGVLQFDAPLLNATTDTIINGPTAGTITIKQWMTGGRIWTDLVFQGYENAPAPQQVVVLPTRYSKGAKISVGGIGNPNSKGIFKLTDGAGGGAVAINIPSALGGGGHTGVTSMQSFTYNGEATAAFDRIWVDGSYTGTTGYAEINIVGV